MSGPDLGTAGDQGADDLGSADLAVPPPAPINPNFDNAVTSAVHAGDAWYIGGIFSYAELISAERAIALDFTGSPAAATCAFQRGFNGTVSGMAQIGNALYLVGAFTTYRGLPANRIAKIDAATCALDTTFSPAASNGFDQVANAIAISGTSVYVGGDFTAYRGVANSAIRLAKLDATTGALDTTFSPPGANNNGFDGLVRSLAVEGTSLYAGGAFASYRNVAGSASALAKLDLTTGALDTTFSPAGATNNGFDSTVRALLVANGSLYAGGAFSKYRNAANSASRVAKLNLTTGALDTTFSPAGANANGFDADVFALAASASALFCAGNFTDYKGVANSANRIAKLDLTSGAIDTTFSPVGANSNGFASVVNALAVSGNMVFAGGQFTTYRGASGSTNSIAKLDATTGVRDGQFRAMGHDRAGFSSGGSVQSLLVSGTTLWAGGTFTQYAGRSANRIARFPDSTGTLDTTFSPLAANGFDSDVSALASDGTSLYVGGQFSAYRGVTNSANYMAKLDLVTGDLDATFSPPGATSNGFNGQVAALLSSGGAIYAGGNFTSYRGVAASARGIAKLDPTSGAIDTTFSPPGGTNNGFDDIVYALAAGNGALYVGGGFTQYRSAGASSANHLAKLDPTTGALDATFSPPGMTANGTDNDVSSLAFSGTGLVVGGSFAMYRTDTVGNIVKVDGATGALDTAFGTPGAAHGFDATVNALATLGTSVYVGGAFTAYRGVATSASFYAKLDGASGAIDTTFTPTGAPTPGVSPVYAVATSGTSVLIGGNFIKCTMDSCAHNAVVLDATTGQ